jgi:hypothetical protein
MTRTVHDSGPTPGSPRAIPSLAHLVSQFFINQQSFNVDFGEHGQTMASHTGNIWPKYGLFVQKLDCYGICSKMSAFPETGRSEAPKSVKSKVCFRPEAAAHPAS